MTLKRDRIYVLGKLTLTNEEREDIEELGQVIAIVGSQLVTADIAIGTPAAVAAGYLRQGGTPEFITNGIIPDSRNLIILADQDFHDRVAQRVPDWKDRGWLMIFDIHRLNIEVLKYLADKGLSLPSRGGGQVGGGKVRRHRGRS